MYKRTEDGKPIDPPVIPEFEVQMNRAMHAADEAEMARINEKYEKARYELADEQDDYERKIEEDQAAKDAEARQVVRDRNKPMAETMKNPNDLSVDPVGVESVQSS